MSFAFPSYDIGMVRVRIMKGHRSDAYPSRPGSCTSPVANNYLPLNPTKGKNAVGIAFAIGDLASKNRILPRLGHESQTIPAALQDCSRGTKIE